MLDARRPESFGGEDFGGRKSSVPRMAAMRIAALHNIARIGYLGIGRTNRRGRPWGSSPNCSPAPRPREQDRYRAALALLNAMSNADRADIGIKPADFPRIARDMALRS